MTKKLKKDFKKLTVFFLTAIGGIMKENIFTKKFGIGVLTSILISLFLYFTLIPIIEEKYIGPRIKAFIYDDLDYNGEVPAFVLDVENTGKVTLHNLYGGIEYSCLQRGFNISDKRAVGPRILEVGGTMQFNFPEEKFIHEVELSKASCSDVAMSLYHVEKINDSTVRLIEGFLAGFDLKFEDELLGTRINSITDLKEETSFNACDYCRIKYSAKSDEISTDGVKDIRVGIVNVDSLLKINDTLNMNIDSDDKWLIMSMTLYFNCGPINCADWPYQVLKSTYPDIISNSIVINAEEGYCRVEPNSSKIMCLSGNKIYCSDDSKCKT